MLRAVTDPARFRFIGIAFLAVLAACSGGSGGGGSYGGSSGGSGGGVLPPSTFSVSGTIVDAGTNGGSGAGISGATTALYAQNDALSTPIVPAVTSSSTGSFTITSVPNGSYVIQVTPPANSNAPTGFSYPYYHANVTVSGATALAAIKLDLLTSDDQAWIVKTNTDRASYGAAALKADETATLAARTWANQLAIDPTVGHGTTTTPQQRYANLGGIGADSENIGVNLADQTWPNIEAAWMAESQSCPQPATYSTCPNPSNGQDTGHFRNIVNPAQAWTGVGENLNGASSPPGSTWSDFDAEYISYP